MEQQSGPGGWNTRMIQPAPKPGQVRLWTFQSVAQGADYVSYFRWRTCAMGTEMYWHGILNYDNRDNRRLAEIGRTYKDLEKIQGAAGAKVMAKVAVLCDYDNEWDGIEDKWHGPLRWQSMDGWFKALERAHIPFDFVNVKDEGTSAPLTGYDLVVYPHPTIMTEARAALLKEYASNGGTLLIGCRSGYKDINGLAPMMPMPGLLAELTGCTVGDFTHIGPADGAVYMVWDGKRVPAPSFNDILEPADGCEVLGVYDGNYYSGAPALTKNKVGEGEVYTFGSVFGEETVAAFIEKLGVTSPVAECLTLPEEMELSVRESADGTKYVFLLNYESKPMTITAHCAMPDLISGETVCGEYTVQPYDVLVLKV
jgi:beta-galactosidase